ncbi:C6 transcription factor [Penicillium longicatenatum]|uniref:C6 transcription factor n=1 Tax=Penicillium longicatenatum TaxID=1561947 RepID=UPI002547C515|nr:C6 transcription factor [Penicillium longicatenatum]KAJ5651462.1 C6 transcription factor [Penicillium longicatenatum]
MAEPKHQAFFESLLAKFVKECGGFGNGATVLKIVKEYWKSREEQGRNGVHSEFLTDAHVLLI